jgi:hypothetical protein
MNDALALMLQDNAQRAIWRSNALKMGETADIYSLFERAADFIVTAVKSSRP